MNAQPRVRKRADQKHAEYNAFLALRSTLFNKKKDESDARTKHIAFAVSRCLEMASRPRSSTASSHTKENIVNVRCLCYGANVKMTQKKNPGTWNQHGLFGNRISKV